MNTLADRLAIALPQRLRTRPKDQRGYPIPFIALIDKRGVPQFTINDDRRVAQCRSKHLCALCGKRFDDFGLWFIGGPKSFTEPNGAFLDPPSHYACALYAIRVCPYLAAPSYARRIDDAKLDYAQLSAGMLIAEHAHATPDRPDVFGLGGTKSYTFHEDAHVFVIDDWVQIEWWCQGQEISAPDAGL